MLKALEYPEVRPACESIRTYTGRKFWPLEPRAEEIAIEDIAHALSLACRFSGHTYCFYSVAEHSLHVSKLAEMMALATLPKKRSLEHLQWVRGVALWGLLHDASEAYLCDLPTPLKHSSAMGSVYRAAEKQLMSEVIIKFDLWPHEPSLVKDADRILLNTEMRDLMHGATWDSGVLAGTIRPMDAQRAEADFLHRFRNLEMARMLGEELALA